jgi:formamidopyrimidine-DNA glycosylase
MPELPEVETIVRDLQSLIGKTFSDAVIHDVFLLRQKPNDFIRRLKGQSIENITRRGKAVIMHLSSGEFLIVQLMMTGQLIAQCLPAGRQGQQDKHTRLTFNFSDESWLLYNDQRRFGQLRVVANLKEINYFNILGPEPFSQEFTPAFIRRAFGKTTRPIKNALLDHSFVAGIGNIYACEILFRSRISPRRQARRLSLAEIKTMHPTVIEVLNEAIRYRGSSMRNYRDGSGARGKFNERLAVYGREGLPCHRSHKPIQRIVQAGRSTFYCRRCQK